MTNTKFTDAAIVIGVLMLLVLPVCAEAPTVGTTTPGRWLNGTDLNIYITGSHFPYPGSGPDYINVTLNQSPLENVTSIGITYNSDGDISASFGPKWIHFGDWNVTVINMTDNSNGTKLNALSVYNNPPTLTSISPEWGLNNSATVPFDLIGTGFFGIPVVNLSSVGITPNVNITATNCQTISSTHISGNFDLSGVGVATAGQWTVNLTNPDGNLSTSTLPFTIWCPAPTITSVNPQIGNTANSALAFSVTGTNYRTGAIVNITNGSTQIPTSGYGYGGLPTQISVFANIAGQPVGRYNVTVINPGPLYNNTTSVNAFQVFYPGAPLVTAITPSSKVNTSNATGVLISGDYFYPGAVVLLNRTGMADIPAPAASVVVNDVHSITCNLTTHGALPGVWYVKVTNNDTLSSNTDIQYTITPPPVPIASFDAAPVLGMSPLNVQFNDTSTNDPAIWNWSFGDGQWYNTTVFANRNITHSYANIGAYTAKLTVSNNSVGSTTEPGTIITVLKNDKVGVFRSGTFYLASSNTNGGATVNAFNYGQTGDKPVVGNWAGSGITTPGVYRNNIFYLRNTNTGGVANTAFSFGQTGDLPVAGHWAGIASDTVGVYRSGTFYLASSNTNGGGIVNAFTFGQAGDIPVAGDWNGDGTTTVGVYRSGTFYLASSNSPSGGTVTSFTFGQAGDIPIAGDWNGDGYATVGVFRSGTFYLASSNSPSGGTVTSFTFGQASDEPAAGYWG